jgi:hypothetical protein
VQPAHRRTNAAHWISLNLKGQGRHGINIYAHSEILETGNHTGEAKIMRSSRKVKKTEVVIS